MRHKIGSVELVLLPDSTARSIAPRRTSNKVRTSLEIGATFFVTDGLQTIAAGALRGLKDTSVPLLFAVISYWGIGFCTAYLLAFHTSLGPPGVWIGLSAGTLVYAALLVVRFRLLAIRLDSR